MMTWATGRLYVDAVFPEESKVKNHSKEVLNYDSNRKLTYQQETITGMIDELQNAFANQILADASWMSEETKQKTLEKLQKMTVLVGYPDWIKVI